MADAVPGTDLDPQETREWQDALAAVIEQEGEERAHFLLETLIDQARRNGTFIPYRSSTAYLNTIPAAKEPKVRGPIIGVANPIPGSVERARDGHAANPEPAANSADTLQVLHQPRPL